MRKAYCVILALCLASIVMAGCGKNVEKTEETKPVETQAETQSPAEEKAEPEVREEEKTAEAEEKKEENMQDAAGVYMTSAKLADIPIGAYVDGEQKVLCSVKMPENYVIASLYMDESGVADKEMTETNGRVISAVIEDKSLESSENVPSTVIITSAENTMNTYTFGIVQSSRVSLETEKEFAPDGIDIAVGTDHDAYAYSTSGHFNMVLVYEINDDWTLLVENSGELKDKMSLEDFGKEFYGLVSPVEWR